MSNIHVTTHHGFALAHNGTDAYKGTLTLGNLTVTACECSDAASAIYANRQE